MPTLLLRNVGRSLRRFEKILANPGAITKRGVSSEDKTFSDMAFDRTGASPKALRCEPPLVEGGGSKDAGRKYSVGRGIKMP